MSYRTLVNCTPAKRVIPRKSWSLFSLDPPGYSKGSTPPNTAPMSAISGLGRCLPMFDQYDFTATYT